MAATRFEFNAVARALQSTHQDSACNSGILSSQERGLHVLLTQSGIGPSKARKSSEQLLACTACDVIISTGFAGDLKTNFIGSVIIGQEVFSGHDSTLLRPIVCHPEWIKMALNVQWKSKHPLRTERFVSVDRVLTSSHDKQQLHVDSGAVGVDMESAAIGEVAQKQGVPFLIVRAISDGVSEDLPVDFSLFLSPSGWVPGIWHIIKTPKSWRGFINLYRQSKQASQQLTRFFQGFFSALTYASIAKEVSRDEG